jgi:hypothetical protein
LSLFKKQKTEETIITHRLCLVQLPPRLAAQSTIEKLGYKNAMFIAKELAEKYMTEEGFLQKRDVPDPYWNSVLNYIISLKP